MSNLKIILFSNVFLLRESNFQIKVQRVATKKKDVGEKNYFQVGHTCSERT